MSAVPDPRPVRRCESDVQDGVLTFPSSVDAPSSVDPRPSIDPPSPIDPPSTVEPLFRELAGRALREERTAQQKTLGQIAERAGLSPQYLSEVERGLKEPSSEMLASICGALGLRLTDLLRAADRQLTVATTVIAAVVILRGTPTSSAVRSAPSGPLLMVA